MSSTPAGGEPIQINYGSGLTPTEELLKQLGERSFLRFWSHANPHISKGKELCDLLVVCGDFIIVFSDKNVVFNTGIPVGVAWPRWYKEAVGKSCNQLGGAMRHLIKLRSQIYKDKDCSVPLGLSIADVSKA